MFKFIHIFLHNIVRLAQKPGVKAALAVPAPLVVLYAAAAAQYQSFAYPFVWMVSNPGIFALYLVLYGALIALFLFLTTSLAAAFALTAVPALTMSLVNYFKYMINGTLLHVSDIVMIGDMKEGVDFADTDLHFSVHSVLPIVLISLYFLLCLPIRIRFSLPRRLGIMAAMPLLLYVLFFTESARDNILPVFGLDITDRYQNTEMYKDKGVILGCYSLYFGDQPPRPGGYDEDYMAKRLEQYIEDNRVDARTPNSPAEKPAPNIVFVMSESFAPLDNMQGLNLSADPTPFYNHLRRTATQGRFVTMTLNGGTANVEFEVLTGNLSKFMPYGSIAYFNMKDYITKDNPTLPKMALENGYSTVAVHPYDRGFYDRDMVYPNLGFEKFVAQDDMAEEEYEGLYISDMAVSRRILSELEASDKPCFVYAITMQNHRPYNTANYDHNVPVTADSPALDEGELDTLNAYIHGLYDADRALEYLVTELEGLDEDTVVMFFGDHRPNLGDQNAIYQKLGVISGWESSEWNLGALLSMLEIPVVVWSSYEDRQEDMGYIGANFLGNYVFDHINSTAGSNGMPTLKKPVYFHVLSSLYGQFSMYRDRIFITGDKVYGAPPSNALPAVNFYADMQYDMQYGDGFLRDALNAYR